MQRLEVSGAVRPLQWSLGIKGLIRLGLGVTSGYRRDITQIWALLRYYTVYSGNIVQSFLDNTLVPNLENVTDWMSRNVGKCHYTLRNMMENHRSHGKVCLWQHYLLIYTTELFKIDIFKKLTTGHWAYDRALSLWLGIELMTGHWAYIWALSLWLGIELTTGHWFYDWALSLHLGIELMSGVWSQSPLFSSICSSKKRFQQKC